MEYHLKEYIKETGLTMSFQMGEYANLWKSHAVRGASLVINLPTLGTHLCTVCELSCTMLNMS